MKMKSKELTNVPIPSGQVRKVTYSYGGAAYVFKKEHTTAQNNLTRRRSFPPVNRGEPMLKAAYKRMLNRKFSELIELDIDNEKCLSLTLTIRNAKYNAYEKISDRFKHFTNEVRSSKKVGSSYVGAVRFIEVQEKGFFHIHCILVFDTADIKLTWKDLHRMWGWGFVKVTAVYYLIGLIDYLTNLKQGVKNEQNDKFTRYPKKARVIYISPNLPRGKSENIDMTVEECAALINDENCIGHLKMHKYLDTETQKVKTCIDKMVLIQILEKRGSSK